MSLTGSSKEPMRKVKGVVISYFSLETEILDCFLYNKGPISKLKMRRIAGTKETENKRLTVVPISKPRWMLTFAAEPQLHSTLLTSLTLNSASSYASPPLAFHSYRTFCFGLVWDRVHYVAHGGLNLQWAMPPNCWAYRCAAPCPEKMYFFSSGIG